MKTNSRMLQQASASRQHHSPRQIGSDSNSAKSSKTAKPAKASKDNAPVELTGDDKLIRMLGVDGARLGGPMTQPLVEYEMRNPSSVFRIYCLKVMVNYIKDLMTMQQLVTLLQVNHRLWMQLSILAEIDQIKIMNDKRSSRDKMLRALRRADLLKQTNPYSNYSNTFELSSLMDASEAGIEEMLARFKPYERKVLRYSLQAIKQIQGDLFEIKHHIANDAIVEAAKPEDVEETREIIQEWQEISELHERNDARLLEQKDVAEVLKNVPETVRECKRNVNHELVRNFMKIMFDRRQIENPVINDMAEEFKQRDDALLKHHANNGLRQFKFAVKAPRKDMFHAVIDEVKKAGKDSPALEVLSERATQQMKVAEQKGDVESKMMINDVFTAVLAKQEQDKLFKDLVFALNQQIDKFVTTLPDEDLTLQQQKEMEWVAKLYDKIDQLKPEANANKATNALVHECREQLALLKQEYPDSEFALNCQQVAELDRYQNRPEDSADDLNQQQEKLANRHHHPHVKR